MVKAVKNLSQEDYFNKNVMNDERTVLILVNSKQRKKIDELLKRVNKESLKPTTKTKFNAIDL